MVERAILTQKNHDVQQLNDIIINQFPGEERNLVSFDEVEGDANNLYQQEYLNSVSTGGLPPHVLKVKRGAPLMLLRNIDPKAGLCNGTSGYLSLEYVIDGVYSTKSNVFNFGVLVLKIISGKRNRDFNHQDHHFNLLGHAWRLFTEGKGYELCYCGLVVGFEDMKKAKQEAVMANSCGERKLQ
nr:wall-associated receptor kinase-like 15 [Arachis hypogaea]